MANVITIALQDRVSAYLPGTGDTVIHKADRFGAFLDHGFRILHCWEDFYVGVVQP